MRPTLPPSTKIPARSYDHQWVTLGSIKTRRRLNGFAHEQVCLLCGNPRASAEPRCPGPVTIEVRT